MKYMAIGLGNVSSSKDLTTMLVYRNAQITCGAPPPPPITINRTGPKKLLLLDMDETMLHAATLNDIYIQEMYGKEAEPSFITSFADRE